MGACTVRVDMSTPLPSGYRFACGTALFSSTYATGGDQLNLANAGFKEKGFASVMVSAPGGYMVGTNATNATFGGVKARFLILNTTTTNGTDQNIPLYEVTSGADLSTVNFTWSAVGEAI